MGKVKDFYLGARPKTLSAAITPVILGSALAFKFGIDPFIREIAYLPAPRGRDYILTVVRTETKIVLFDLSSPWMIMFACLIVALALQIGVNYANDYSDGIKGTDKDRVGPMRLVGSGRASAKSVLVATLISFGIAAVAGIYIASQSSWWLILVGAVCIVLAWFYTGGKYAYGYYGFGELVVFICFGLVATAGTYFALAKEITFLSIVISFIPGMFCVAILLANNIRDIDTDIKSGKKTLAVRIGHNATRIVFVSSIIPVVAAILIISFSYLWILPALIPCLIWISISKNIYSAQNPKEYIPVLTKTSQLNLIVSIIASVGILVS